MKKSWWVGCFIGVAFGFIGIAATVYALAREPRPWQIALAIVALPLNAWCLWLLVSMMRDVAKWKNEPR